MKYRYTKCYIKVIIKRKIMKLKNQIRHNYYILRSTWDYYNPFQRMHYYTRKGKRLTMPKFAYDITWFIKNCRYPYEYEYRTFITKQRRNTTYFRYWIHMKIAGNFRFLRNKYNRLYFKYKNLKLRLNKFFSPFKKLTWKEYIHLDSEKKLESYWAINPITLKVMNAPNNENWVWEPDKQNCWDKSYNEDGSEYYYFHNEGMFRNTDTELEHCTPSLDDFYKDDEVYDDDEYLEDSIDDYEDDDGY